MILMAATHALVCGVDQRARSARSTFGMSEAAGVVGGVFELVFPAEHFGLGAEFFGGGFVAFFHPDAGERGVDEEVVGAEGEAAFGGAEGVVEAAEAEIDFGEGVPGFEGCRGLLGGAGEFGEGGVVVAHRVVEGGVFDEGLDVVGVGHAVL